MLVTLNEGELEIIEVLHDNKYVEINRPIVPETLARLIALGFIKVIRREYTNAYDVMVYKLTTAGQAVLDIHLLNGE
tara:strand:- start:1168 stop:1398 length:231 start_codon:yes stop_codon:yes gene_type:complete